MICNTKCWEELRLILSSNPHSEGTNLYLDFMVQPEWEYNKNRIKEIQEGVPLTDVHFKLLERCTGRTEKYWRELHDRGTNKGGD